MRRKDLQKVVFRRLEVHQYSKYLQNLGHVAELRVAEMNTSLDHGYGLCMVSFRFLIYVEAIINQ
jgi:hypothetical protein